MQPKDSYSSATKNKYREAVWDYFAKSLNVDKAVVLFFPGRDGLEIPVAMKRGFKEENLIAIDTDDGVFTQQWAQEYPRIKKINASLGNTNKFETRIDAANLDFCGNISSLMVKELRRFSESDSLQDDALVAITVLRGRESQERTGLIELAHDLLGINSGIDARLGLAFHALFGYDYAIRRHGSYRNSSTMVWGIGHKKESDSLIPFSVRRQIRSKIVSGIKNKRDNLIVYNRNVPFGYRRVGNMLETDSSQQETLREIRKMRKMGKSLRAIAEHLNGQGLLTNNGGKMFYPQTIKQILGAKIHEYKS